MASKAAWVMAMRIIRVNSAANVGQKMDSKRVKNQSSIAFKVTNLRVVWKHIHPEYRYEACEGGIAENGRLDVLKLVHADDGCPSFSARWDQRPDELDIDIHHPSDAVVDDFKGGKNGYRGHHTKQFDGLNSRTFEVIIKTPEGLIFDGTASFALHANSFLPKKLK
jgi:hypothetical protein